MANHVTLWFQLENGSFASFDTNECVKPCYCDRKHDHLKIVPIIATSFDPGVNSTECPSGPSLGYRMIPSNLEELAKNCLCSNCSQKLDECSLGRARKIIASARMLGFFVKIPCRVA